MTSGQEWDLDRLRLKRQMDAEDIRGIPLPFEVEHRQDGLRWPCLGEWKDYWVVRPVGVTSPLLVSKAQWWAIPPTR